MTRDAAADLDGRAASAHSAARRPPGGRLAVPWQTLSGPIQCIPQRWPPAAGRGAATPGGRPRPTKLTIYDSGGLCRLGYYRGRGRVTVTTTLWQPRPRR